MELFTTILCLSFLVTLVFICLWLKERLKFRNTKEKHDREITNLKHENKNQRTSIRNLQLQQMDDQRTINDLNEQLQSVSSTRQLLTTNRLIDVNNNEFSKKKGENLNLAKKNREDSTISSSTNNSSDTADDDYATRLNSSSESTQYSSSNHNHSSLNDSTNSSSNYDSSSSYSGGGGDFSGGGSDGGW